MATPQRLLGLLCFSIVACEQQSAITALPVGRGVEAIVVCSPGFYETTAGDCAAKIQGATPGPSDTVSGNFSDGCVSGESDANHYCTIPSFGGGDCDVTAQCAFVYDTQGRQAGCDPTTHTCSVPGCGPGSYVSADGLCHDLVASGAPAPADTQSGDPTDGCVSSTVAGAVCAAPLTGSGNCWFDTQCVDVTTNNASTMGCMANHHCGPTACAPGYYVTASGTCSLKLTATPAPHDTLAESIGGSRYTGCVSGVGDPNTYCVPPVFGAGDCALTSQCASVVDSDGRTVGCDPTAHTCSVPGCGPGSYVSADGLCHDKLADGDVAPSDTQTDDPADGCVSGALAGVLCAAATTGSGDCWDDAQCAGITTANATGMGCMANRHCGPTACAAGYYVTRNGTCALKISGWTPAPLDTLTESLGGGRASGCVSGANDANNYCVPPSLGGGDCALDDQCVNVFSGNVPAVGCDLASHSCAVCQNGTYRAEDSTCRDKLAGGVTAPVDTYSGDPAAGCVSGATDEAGNCTVPTSAGGDCYTDAQCAGLTVAGASAVGCLTTVHNCGVQACAADFYLANGACATCTVCTSGSRRTAACTATTDATCLACAPGTYAADTNSDSCTLCPADTFSGAAASSCTACDTDTHAEPGSNACTHCDPGSAYEGGTCTTCDAGSYAADGDTACTECPAGTYAAAGATSCTACDPGSYAGVGASACILCAPGTFADTAGAPWCRACPAGTLAPEPGALTCNACPGGQFVSDGVCVACTVCAPGERRVQACTSVADTVCEPCTTGTFASASDSDACTLCPAETFAGPGASSCTPCSLGTHAAAGSGTCSQCDAGSLYDSGQCTACAAGTAAVDNAVACLACGPGTFSEAGAASCIACAPGYHASRAGADTCELCAAGTFATSAGAIACQACPAGSVSSTGAIACTACPSGSFAPAGSATCSTCGNCDDGNDCTQDACDATRGCTHVSICAPVAQSSITDLGTQPLTVSGGCSALASEPEVWLALVALVALRRRRGLARSL